MASTSPPIDRRYIVSHFNPSRNASGSMTGMQVGNGDFAFTTDITGLQTFQPFSIMSGWGWKNDSFPPGRTLEDILDYQGVSWLNHGRLVEYMFDGVADIQQWLISNPNRVNLGRVGLVFFASNGSALDVTEESLLDKNQTLDIWSGRLYNDVVAVEIESDLLENGKLGLFLDFPWNDGSQKFEAPFVGVYNMTANHTTALNTGKGLPSGAEAMISHTLVNSTFFATVGGNSFEITRDSLVAHRYTIKPKSKSSQFAVGIAYALQPASVPSTSSIVKSSVDGWSNFWSNDGFLDVLTGTSDPRAKELQRRVILSRYHMRVNAAGALPPQESGLMNNGWEGKFHLEEVFWHTAHWGLWNNWDIYTSILSVYDKFLQTSLERSQKQQHWDKGARWGKESDPSGRSAPGEINELLIWQQPHPLVFAEYEYRNFPTKDTLEKWEEIIFQTAEWMSAFAWWNGTAGWYDLGPPMYVVAEDTSPNVTINPAFELAYWRFGLQLAETWMNRLGKPVPLSWTLVKDALAHLPVENGTYAVYQGIEDNFYFDPTYINDHPALVGLYGWLPMTPGLNLSTMRATTEMVWATWNLTNCWGWDFPMLAMNSAKLNDAEKAIEWLLDPLFAFDDIGMPIGGVRVPTPYFPGSGALLLATAMMAKGWDGSEGHAPGFPLDWTIRYENLNTAF